MKEKYQVTGMTCSACSSHVEKSVGKLKGVSQVSVNLLTNSMSVEYQQAEIDSTTIISTVENAGYGANLIREKGNLEKVDILEEGKKSTNQMKVRLLISLLFWIPLMYIDMGHMIFEKLSIPIPSIEMRFLHGTENAVNFAFLQFLLVLPIIIVNRKFFVNGFKMLFRRNPNMDSLIAIGAGAAIVYGVIAIFMMGYGLGHNIPSMVDEYRTRLYIEAAGTILTLITVGKYLETKSKGKTSEAISKLLDLTPKTVTVIRNGQEILIEASELQKNEEFIVRPGESVVADAIIVDGRSSFDESAITGESIPVLKGEKDLIVSASLNKTGIVRARATKVGEDTTIAQIIRLVEEASASKAPIAQLADKIAGVFVPIVIIIALLTAITWLVAGAGFDFALSSMIAVLVISCPCALGLATPVAIMVGTGKGAENGILIKSGEALETAHSVDVVVLDKTGTITQGKPQVTDVLVQDHLYNRQSLLRIAASLEKGSEHPLAEAIVQQASTEQIVLTKVTDFEALFGRGIQGKIEGIQYFAGNETLLKEKHIVVSELESKQIYSFATQGKTPMIFFDETHVIGIIAVADVVKETSKEAIKKLKKMGLHVIMLTGDHEVTAKAIQKQVGVDEVIAGVLPTQKEEKVAILQSEGHKVAMVGDGINDAPALARADIGIAIGAGTDIAIESADVVLMQNDLLDVVKAIHLSRGVIRNIKQNLFWAFIYNVIGIPLAAGLLVPFTGLRLSPMFGAAAMSLSSICVVLNALRLKGLKLTQKKKAIHLSAKEERKEESKMKTTILTIEGMSCGHCTKRVEEALSQITGVSDVMVSLEKNQATVIANESVEVETLSKAVKDAGYDVIGIY